MTPPLEPLLELVARLEAEGIRCAPGGGGRHAALGLTETVHDWDLTVDASLEQLAPLGGPAHSPITLTRTRFLRRPSNSP